MVFQWAEATKIGQRASLRSPLLTQYLHCTMDLLVGLTFNKLGQVLHTLALSLFHCQQVTYYLYI
jgi:hypothetical protein